MTVYQSILDSIGNTPLVEIRRLNPNPRVRIFAKIEAANPGGSIKDRTALFMIEGAERRGELTPDKIILEATSGNTGIGLAMIAAAKGYTLCLTMSEAASDERKKILRAMGAQLVFTPASQGTDGAIEEAYRLLRDQPDRYFGTDQFNNEDNIAAHYLGTAPEIWAQTEGRVTAVVATLGTSGTAMGLSVCLKEFNPDIRIIGVEPYLKHKIQGLKNMRESYRPGIFDKRKLDEKVNIQDEDAFEMSRRLAREEGILAGMSSGAAMFVAAKKAAEMNDGCIVVIFPDSGERYLSTELFAVKEELASLNLYNVLKRRKLPFKPLQTDSVRIRSCGPTVHDAPHLGNYRRLVVSDLLCRFLSEKGHKVRHVVDIVDLTDKSLKGSEKVGMDLKAYSDKYTAIFLDDVRFLNIRDHNIYARASENMDEMLKIVEKLVDKEYAYEKLHSVYYDISKKTDYGRLSGIDLSKTRQGRSVDVDDYEKDAPADFALLKRTTLSELKRGVYYKTHWGNVRPGWHLECAAISRKYLGDAYDIHICGTDEIFPHCENILAINKAFSTEGGAVSWMSVEMIMVEGRKMSRSFGNAISLDQLKEAGYSGCDIRFFLMGMNYRKPIAYSSKSLDAAKNTLKKLNLCIARLGACAGTAQDDSDINQMVYDFNHGFDSAMDDDLNVSGALAALFEFVGKINRLLSHERINASGASRILDALARADRVLGVMDFNGSDTRKEISELISKRDAARKASRFEEADALRQRLVHLGLEILDTPQGTIWRKVQ